MILRVPLSVASAVLVLALLPGTPSSGAGAMAGPGVPTARTRVDLDNDLATLSGPRVAASGGVSSAAVRNCGRNRKVTLIVAATGRVLGTDRTDFDGGFYIPFDAIRRKRLTALTDPTVRHAPRGRVVCSGAKETERVRVGSS